MYWLRRCGAVRQTPKMFAFRRCFRLVQGRPWRNTNANIFVVYMSVIASGRFQRRKPGCVGVEVVVLCLVLLLSMSGFFLLIPPLLISLTSFVFTSGKEGHTLR